MSFFKLIETTGRKLFSIAKQFIVSVTECGNKGFTLALELGES